MSVAYGCSWSSAADRRDREETLSTLVRSTTKSPLPVSRSNIRAVRLKHDIVSILIRKSCCRKDTARAEAVVFGLKFVNDIH